MTLRLSIAAVGLLGLGVSLLVPAEADQLIPVQVSEGTGMAVSATADGRALITDLQGHLWVLPGAGGSARALTDGRGDDRLPRVSPDGRHIVFQSYRLGHWDLWLMDIDGSNARPLTRDLYDDREPVWAPDGQSVIFSSDRGNGFDIWRADVATGALAPLTNAPGDEYWPAVSPDGRRIAYVGDDGAKAAILEGPVDGAQAPVAGTSVSKPLAPVYSPDGHSLAFVMPSEQLGFPSIARQALWQIPVSGGTATRLSTPEEDVFPLRPDWTAANQIYYTADGGIRRRAPGTEALRIPFTAQLTVRRAAYRRAAWTPPGARQTVRGILDLAANPATGALVFVALGDLWQREVSGSVIRLTDDVFLERDPAFAPDGRQLAFVSDRAGSMQVWIRDLSTGTERQLTRQPKGLRHPVFTADGRAVVFQQPGPRGNQDFTLHRAELADGRVTSINAPGIWPGPAAVRGDAVLVAVLKARSARFREGRNELQWIPLAGGTPVPLPLPDDVAPDGDFDLAPDGRTLAVVVDGRLHVQSLDEQRQASGALRVSSRDLAASPAWLPGGEVAYVGQKSLTRVAATGGRQRQLSVDLPWSANSGKGTRRIRAGRLFDGTGAGYRLNVDILIRDDRIVAVEPAKDNRDDGIPTLDASRATVLPGLFDSHAHQQPHEGIGPGKAWLAFGVTSLVEPGGSLYESVEQSESWDSGRRPGPRLFYAGPQLDGDRRFFPFAVHADGERRLGLEQERNGALGARLTKTYTRLPGDLQVDAITRSHRQGLPVTSHDVYPAIALGADRVEHLRGTSRLGYSAKQSDALNVYGDVIALMGGARATLCPTVVVGGGFFDFFIAHPEIRTLPGYIDSYPAADRQGLEAFAGMVKRRQALLADGVANARQALLAYHRAGVRIVAGTDAPIFPPGLSLVAELVNYRAAGLPGDAVLRSATAAAADAIGAGTHLGRIAPGMLADLIIVDGDPLADPAALLRVRTTMRGGRIVAGEAAW